MQDRIRKKKQSISHDEQLFDQLLQEEIELMELRDDDTYFQHMRKVQGIGMKSTFPNIKTK